ncbi:NAD(+) diphosphatase [Nocardioides marmoriginsengisoli]|uniref:NAD(+) diphosphatase n=1 Tax=Nocardioides marmoriginsengisoli TaxID=661483 RepID=A0A3N0CDE6_9ACTN|nr:NAD(+) diphosphatase [Nocardioides marmoriginsengisoli]RNL61023.1 NAD(+) diphosphatase [Nocardioides marmoriginsengisoli]
MSAEIAFSRYAHDRIGDRRTDEAWLAEVWADPATRVLVIAGTRIGLVDGAIPWVSPAEAPEGDRVLLGEHDGVVHFAVIADGGLAGEDWMPLRGLVLVLTEDDAPLVVHAMGIAEWLWATRHCIRCGGRYEIQHLGHVLRCTDCGREEFPRTDPAVIMVVTDGEHPEDRCLLGRHPSWPPGRYSTLAGFVEPGESIEQAVRREVHEESGITVGEVEYFGSQPWPLPRSLMIGCLGKASSTEISVDGEEIEDARWFTRQQMKDEAEAGTLVLPGGISISRSLIEHWYGGALPGSW